MIQIILESLLGAGIVIGGLLVGCIAYSILKDRVNLSFWYSKIAIVIIAIVWTICSMILLSWDHYLGLSFNYQPGVATAAFTFLLALAGAGLAYAEEDPKRGSRDN